MTGLFDLRHVLGCFFWLDVNWIIDPYIYSIEEREERGDWETDEDDEQHEKTRPAPMSLLIPLALPSFIPSLLLYPYV